MFWELVGFGLAEHLSEVVIFWRDEVQVRIRRRFGRLDNLREVELVGLGARLLFTHIERRCAVHGDFWRCDLCCWLGRGP